MITLHYQSKFAALSIALLGLFGFSTALAQVEITSSTGTRINGQRTSYSLANFDPGNGANKLIVAVSAEGNGGVRTVSDITFGDIELTPAITSGNQRRTEIWFLDNPGSDPANISVTWTGNINGLGIAVYSLANAANGVPPITGGIAGNSLTVTTTQDNSLVIASYVSNDGTNNDGIVPALPTDSPYNLTYGSNVGSALGAAASHFLPTPGDSTFTILEPSPFASTAAIVVESIDVGSVPLIVTTLSDERDTPFGAALSLREAISIAPSGETITFAPELSGGVIQLNGAAGFGELVIDKSLTIDASALDDGIIIDGGSDGDFSFDDESGCLFILGDEDLEERVSVTLSHLTIRNGVADSSEIGANLTSFGADLILESCLVQDGRATEGAAGIFFLTGDLTMSDCVVSGNESESPTLLPGEEESNELILLPGGMLTINSAVTLTRCTITDNQAGIFGGGISHLSGPFHMAECTVSNNRLVGGPGAAGMIISSSDTQITNSLIAGNEASGISDTAVGGIVLLGDITILNFDEQEAGDSEEESQSLLTNCTIDGNQSPTGAGGLFNQSTSCQLLHCTITDNVSLSGSGGGIASALTTDTLTELTSCIVRDNSGADLQLAASIVELDGLLSPVPTIESTFLSGGTNIVGDGDGVVIFTESGDVIGTNTPILLAPLANYGGPTESRPPLLGSPAIDAAVGSTAFFDQRGFPVRGIPDIGATEFTVEITVENITPIMENGVIVQVDITFSGLDTDSLYFLDRGTDLQSFPTEVICFFPDTSTFVVSDFNPPSGPGAKAFYRLSESQGVVRK